MTDAGVIAAAGTAVAGIALGTTGIVSRARARDAELVDVLRMPYGETDVQLGAITTEHGTVVASTLGLANRAIERFGDRDGLRSRIERADLSLRPAELVVISASLGVAVGFFLAALTGVWWMAGFALLATPAGAAWFLGRRAAHRSQRFASQLPEALGLVSSSLSAGHTFLRSIQMIAEEFEEPLAGEFGRVVAESQLGSPLVDALERMGRRLSLREVDWMVQAIRIQQHVGGQLADLLATLADLMRDREEVRREIKVLTAEGRISAWVLGGLPVALFVVVQVVNPGYLSPMLHGWGPAWLGATAAAMAAGISMILHMVKKVEV